MNSSKKRIVSGVIWSLAERIAAQSVSLIVTIVLARLLTPTEYGTISLVAIFITIANVFITDGLGTALIQKKDADSIDFSTIFYFGIIMSLGIYFFLAFFVANWVADFYNMPILLPVLRVLALKIPIAAINSVQQAYVSRKMIFRKFFYATLSGTLVSAIVGIYMAYCGYGVWALVAQELTNTTIDTIVLWSTVKWRPIIAFSIERLRGLLGYSWKLLFQSIFNTLYGNFRSLLIGKVYSAQDLAYYTNGSRYPNLIVTNVDTSMSKALFPAMSMAQEDFTRVKAIARRATKLCSYVMCPLLMGLAACANTFVLFLLTEKWLPIVPYMQIICFCLLFRAAQTSILQAIKATGKSDMVLKMDIPVRIFGIVIVVVAVRFGLIFVALSEIVVETVGYIIYGLTCGKVVGYKLHESIIDFGGNAIQAFIMAIGIVIFGHVTHFSSFVTLVLQVILGIVIYMLLSILFRNENFTYLLQEVKKYINR